MKPAVRGERPLGLRMILGYKIVKAILQLAGAAYLFYGATHGLATRLAAFADQLREHAVHAWSNLVAAALMRLVHGRHNIWFVAIALLGDAVLSGVEAWALARGYAWGEWLVVLASAALVPFELLALARHLRLGRLVLLVVNLAIVAYLGGRVAKRVRRHEGSH